LVIFENPWRGLVRVTPETFWMRETTTEGRFAKKNSHPAVFPDWHRARARVGLRVNLRPAA
jgi:hypothetical protein